MALDPGFGRPVSTSVRAIIGSGWGRPRPNADPPTTHEGVDIWLPVGTPVIAVQRGLVQRSYDVERGAAGKYVSLLHQGGWTTRYMHLSRAVVPVGAVVAKGQLIGYSGDTGTGSTGPHLHFDLKVTEATAAAIAKAVGAPRGGFAPYQAGFGIGVPAEPWLPVDGYTDRTVAEAIENGIPLYPLRVRARRTQIWVIAGASTVAIASVVTAWWWRRATQ